MLPVCSESSKTMRAARPVYILPFLVNLALIYSSVFLVHLIDQSIMEETSFSMSGWALYATIAVVSPTCLSFIRLLPDPSISLAIGGLITSAGLLWSWFASGPMVLVSFGLVTGTGISLSLQSVCISISPYFIREKATVTVLILLVSSAVILTMNLLMAYIHIYVSTNILLYFCGAVLISSVVPLPYFLYSCHQKSESKTDFEAKLEKRFEFIFQAEEEPQKMRHIGFCDNVKMGVKNMFVNEGWISSIISVGLWLSWGAGISTTWISLSSSGIDSSWMTLGWRYHYFSSSASLAALQLTLCFLLLVVKILTEFHDEATPSFKVNLASNYMHLGLLGAAGVILCLFPEHSQPFHNHLLFTMGFALQFDDLSDLCLVSEDRKCPNVSHYQLVKYHVGMKVHGDERVSALRYLITLVSHLICLLLMSCLAMTLGVHIANFLGFLSTLPPISFLCTRAGLLVLSVAGIGVALLKPGRWMRYRHKLIKA